jgi:hypothetical protein
MRSEIRVNLIVRMDCGAGTEKGAPL